MKRMLYNLVTRLLTYSSVLVVYMFASLSSNSDSYRSAKMLSALCNNIFNLLEKLFEGSGCKASLTSHHTYIHT